VAVMFLDYPSVEVPKTWAATMSGRPAMMRSDAQVWRRPWKPIAGSILAALQASSSAGAGVSCPSGYHQP
jgi:hypothetical protein